MIIERWGYRITVRWPWIALAICVTLAGLWFWVKGWFAAAVLAFIVAMGIVAGPGIDVERLSDLKGPIMGYPNVPLEDINECYRERKVDEKAAC